MKNVKRRVIIALPCMVAVFWLMTAGGIFAEEDSTSVRGWEAVVEIEPGNHYRSRKWFGIFPVRLVPQIAVWIETSDGEYAGCLFSSSRNTEQRWRGANERPEALPVFNARRGSVDTVSGASPDGKSAITIEADLNLVPGDYYVYAEVNQSYDYNESYPKENSGVNGQPSLVYRGTLGFDGTADRVRLSLSPMGTGSLDGSHGRIESGTLGLSTALEIVDSIEVEFRTLRYGAASSMLSTQ